MKEKPILFSTPMVQALLNTKPGAWPAEPIDPEKPFKCQTRRVINKDIVNQFDIEPDGRSVCAYIDRSTGDSFEPTAAAKYHVGDLLWVRETFCKLHKEHVIEGNYVYKATTGSDAEWVRQDYIKRGYPYQWKPSIFMPREAARIFLEVKSVRVERVQDISEKDAKSEGINHYKTPCIMWACKRFNQMGCKDNAPNLNRCGYRILWDTLNAKRGYSWDSNPWVWVYEFMRVEK